ncbi:hypothetical protein LMG26857_03472 [Achromobacter anxifer]|uniref:DNA-binding protein n=1 Tax=Achromobacter anxifer TaxID=1287737 RepID=UPI00155C5180|nr:DNA-binding protein [Achromobacter anxifer]CAB5514413.1 hypothetical protein LMG26857_03472 [Achromobacter anxifer]
MSRPIATPEAIDAAITAILTEGKEPSIILIQERIGGGSFSTVKRGFDAWKQRRARDAASAPPAPAEIVDRGLGFVQELWANAHRQAQRDVDAIRAQTEEQLAQARAEIDEATQEVARLERVESDQQERLSAFEAQLSAAQQALTEAKVQAARAADLERDLVAARAELAAAREAAQESGELAAKLTGERDAALGQVRELTAVLRAPAASQSMDDQPQAHGDGPKSET